MERAHIGLGANEGDRLETLSAALRDVDALPETAVIAVSRIYESESWPDPDDPPFANGVAVIDTGLAADVLLDALQDIERTHGREPAPAGAPRPVDLDILLMGDEEWESERLTIPHPRLLERDFVIAPLLEVDPLVSQPDGTPIEADRVRYGRVMRVLGALPGFESITRDIEHADRHASDEWVEVAVAGETGRGEGFPAVGVALMFERSVLDGEGIPYVWDPYPPEQFANPYGIKPLFRLLVPVSLAEKAKYVLAAAAAAPPVFDEDAETG